MLMLGLKEIIDRLEMANSVHWYGHVMRREDCHVWRRSLALVDEGQIKKGKSKREWRKQVEEESVMLTREGMMCLADESGVLA